MAATRLGRDYTRLVVFSSLSKRSNVPGMRSGFVAGNPGILRRFGYRASEGYARVRVRPISAVNGIST